MSHAVDTAISEHLIASQINGYKVVDAMRAMTWKTICKC